MLAQITHDLCWCPYCININSAVICDSNAAIKPAISSWAKQYRKDAVAGATSILTFLLNACGCKQVVTPDMLEVEAATALNDIQSNVPDDDSVYPLTDRRPAFKKFESRLQQALDMLVSSVENEVFTAREGEDDILSTFIDWSIALSR